MIGSNELSTSKAPTHKKGKSSSWWNWCKRSSSSSQDVKQYEIKRAQLTSIHTDPQNHICCTCNHPKNPPSQQRYLYEQAVDTHNNIIELTQPTHLPAYNSRVNASLPNYQALADPRERYIANNSSQIVAYNYPQYDSRIEASRISSAYFQPTNIIQSKIVGTAQVMPRSVHLQQLPPQIPSQPQFIVQQPVQIQKIVQPQISAAIQPIPASSSQSPVAHVIVQQNLQIVPQTTPSIVVAPNQQGSSNIQISPVPQQAAILPHQALSQSQHQKSLTSSQHPQNIQNNQIAQQNTQNVAQQVINQQQQHNQYEGANKQPHQTQQYQQQYVQQYPPQQYMPQQYSNQSQYPPQYYQQGDQQQYPPQYYEQNPQQMNPQSSLWQDRFFFLYQKFQIFYEKYDGVTKQTGYLAEQFLHVDNQEQWLALKQKYDLLVQRMNEVREQNALIFQEMQENIQQNQKIDNSQALKEEASRVWQHRYHELLEQYQSLSHHYAELQSPNNPQQQSLDQHERIAMMDEKYAQLEAEYNSVVEQLQNSSNTVQSRQQHEDLLKYTQQLQGYIEQLEAENNTLVKGMKNSVEGSKMIDQTQVGVTLAEKDTEIQNLTQMVVGLEDKLRKIDQSRPKSNIQKDVQTSQYENQIHQMTLYCGQLEQKLSLKEYEINGLNDKIAYLKEQLQLKNEQIASNSRMIHEKLFKIQSDLIQKNIQESSSVSPPPSPAPVTVKVMAPVLPPVQPSEYRFDEDYQSRLQDYQRSITSKNNQIRELQERINEFEADLRKANSEKNGIVREWQQKVIDLQDENRNRLAEKESKIRDLQEQIEQLQSQNNKKVEQKEAKARTWQFQLTKLKEEVDFKLLEKEITIKNLKENATRLENQIKQRNIQLSQVRTSTNKAAHLRSNAGFSIDNARYEDGNKSFNDQLQKKNEQISKLKKQRDTRNKQYKSLQQEYATLQQQNNKRRIEISNLKRQISTLQNLSYEVESFRANLSKRNQEIIDLKNSLSDGDKLRLQIDSKQRQIQKLTEINRYKTSDIEQLTERNYELQQKLRFKQFTISSSSKNHEYKVHNNSSNQEELIVLKDELRKKEVELSRFRIENEQLSKKLKRESEELQNLQFKYPSKIKQIEDESNDLKVTLGSLQKKYAVIEAKWRQAEETNKKIKTNLTQQFTSQNIKLKEYYVRFIQKLQEEIRSSKDKNRKYELELQDYEQQIDNLTNANREIESSKVELQRKLKSISDKLDEKQSEMRILKGKENGQINILRKKEARYIEVEAEAKSKDQQVKDLEKKVEVLKSSLKVLKNEYEDYKNSMLDRMEANNNREMDNINQQLVDYESRLAYQNNHFDFKLKDKRANQVFERRVIYELKEEIERLQRQLDGKGINISLQKMKITAMQQQALMKSKHILKKDDQSASQEIKFYKEKNKELEERVNSHIAVNKNLRERLEYVLQENSKHEDADKLKIKVAELQAKVGDYEDRIPKLLEENKAIRKEFSSLEATSSLSQQFQIQMQEMNRRINQLTLERNSLQQQLSAVRAERDNLQQKGRELQRQLTKQTNQLVIYQSELQRVKSFSRQQFISYCRKESSAGGEHEDFRRKLEELSRELANKDAALNFQIQKSQHTNAQYQSLQIYIQKMEIQLKQLKSKTLHPQYYIDYHRLQVEEVERLKGMLSDRENVLTELRKRIAQLENDCQYYKSQQQGGVPADAFYYVELIRNNYLQLESLASEIGLQNERLVLLAQRVGQDIKRGLQSCQYLHETLSS